MTPADDSADSALAAQFDATLRLTNHALVGSVEAWHALARSYVAAFEDVARISAGLLVDWHEKLLASARR